MPTTSTRLAPAQRQEPSRRAGVLPGVGAAAAGVVLSVLLGVVAANARLVPDTASPGLRLVVKKLLRLGVVLLGFSLPLATVLDLGFPVIGLVVVTLSTTLVLTVWLGIRMGLGRSRSLLIGTGFAICGASAVAAMEQTAEADEEDVATAVGMVTVWGTVAMIALPLLQAPLGLSGYDLGVWAGASVHEVGQVVAAAGPGGAVAVSVAVAVKLTRVLLLAPVVTVVSGLRRRSARGERGEETAGKPPALVPLFVLGFLACVALRSIGAVPTTALPLIEQVQTWALAAGLFALGTGVRLRSLRRSGGRAMALGGLATLVVVGMSLPGVLWLA